MWEVEHNVPLPRVKSDGPWMLHSSGNECGAHIPIKLGHFDLVQIAVNPVQFVRNPVHSQALWGGQTMLNHHLDPHHPCNNNFNDDSDYAALTISEGYASGKDLEEKRFLKKALPHCFLFLFYLVSLSNVKFEVFPQYL